MRTCVCMPTWQLDRSHRLYIHVYRTFELAWRAILPDCSVSAYKGQLENTETRERKRERKRERQREQPKDLENVSHILSPRVSDEPELAPHWDWVHSSIRKLIPRSEQAESPACTKNRTHLPTSSQFHDLRPHNAVLPS